MSSKSRDIISGGLMGGGLGALAGGIFGGSDDEEKAMEMLQLNSDLYGGIELPEFETYNPELYEYAGDYSPEEAQAQTISEDPRLRSHQESYLKKLAGLSEEGLSAEDELGFAKARSQAAQIARSGNEAALQNAQARGVAGSGLEFVMREAANQAAAERAQMGGLEQAAQAARQRALYNQAYGSELSGQRDQDFRANSSNANIINQFNQMNTQNGNQAQLRNLDTRQQLGNQNTGLKNDAVQYRNSMKQQQFGNQMQKTGGMTGANEGMAKGYAAQSAADEDFRKTIIGGATTIGGAAIKGK